MDSVCQVLPALSPSGLHEVATGNVDDAMMKQIGFQGVLGIVLMWGCLLPQGCASTTKRLNLHPIQTVPHVDLTRYLGTWYEIAAFPQWFQRGCTCTTAQYSLRSDGGIDVLNNCRLDSPTGKLKTAKGRAQVVDRATNAKLEVSFFWPFRGDYWIIDLGPDYEYAVVGHPNRDYLWILARKPAIDDAIYQSIVQRLKTQGYQVERLVRTIQVLEE